MMRCFSPYGAIDRAFGRLPLAAGTSRLEKVPLDLPQVLALKGDVPVHGAESAPIVAASGRGLQRQGPLLERRTLDRPRVLPIRPPISFISSPALFLHQARAGIPGLSDLFPNLVIAALELVEGKGVQLRRIDLPL